jgi:2-(3-amino-3-carboxypropyl)histidine synthase
LIPVSDLIERLRDRKAKRVALQFPAGLKRQAWGVALALRKAGFEVIISGDPCYGACDLALGAAALADVLVHFGHAPVSGPDQVIYELASCDIDVEVLSAALPILTKEKIGLVTTVQHIHQIGAMAEYLKGEGIDAITAQGGPRTPYPGQVLGCSFEAAKKTGAEEILYVGTGLFHPTGIQLATGARVIALDPYTREAVEVDASRMLRKRFALMEKAKIAESFGIIVSLKSGQKRLELAERLAGLSDKAVLIAMEEVSPDELLNLGFGAYVNTACPRLAYDDQIRFPVPVISPQEFEIICGVRAFDDYEIDEIC